MHKCGHAGKHCLTQREAEVARQEMGRQWDETVTLPNEPSVAGSSGAGIDTQQSLVITQAHRFECLQFAWAPGDGR